MADHLKLFTNPQSRGQIAHWMMEELGKPYETVWLEYGPNGNKSPEYLELNPMGKIPTLVHHNQVVTECAAICAYCAELNPEKNLKPSGQDLAAYYRWLFFTAGPLEHAIVNKSLGYIVPEEKQSTVGYGNFEQAVSCLESYLGRHDFICGDSFSAADVYVGSHVLWGLQFKTLPDLKHFLAYKERLIQRPGYQRCKKMNEDQMVKN